MTNVLGRILAGIRRGARVVHSALGVVLLWALARTIASATMERTSAPKVLTRIREQFRREMRRIGGWSDAFGHGNSLSARVTELEQAQASLLLTLFDRRQLFDPASTQPVPHALAAPVAAALLDRGDALDAHGLLTDSGGLTGVEPVLLRRLARGLRRRGYLARALETARECVRHHEHTAKDEQVVALLEGEIAVLSGAFVPAVAARGRVEPRAGRILHLVGNSLPDKQSGYTLRTHYTVRAQRDAGLDPHVVTQMGVAPADGDAITYVDGIPYHRIAGPPRSAEPLDRWLGSHVERVADLAAALRPAVLHAASDFVNACTARAVGAALGVPVVYETRGFWEETWLSRQAETYGWTDVERLRETHGLPDTYLWRRSIEDSLRAQVDRVVTLADVMAERIVAGGVAADRISVIPNAVDVDAFPMLGRDAGLAAELGIAEGDVVIGYISSIVEYEGIDTLVAAYAQVKASSPVPVALLVVGGGPERERILAQVEELGLADAILPGIVPHDAILRYYSLIDIFVVPRKPVEVCHLVTPLKPFEAFATGRAVVLSDVRALAAIAAESGAAELFQAGNPASLAEVLLALLADPVRRKHLAEDGARWVRAERTWAANARSYRLLYEEMGVLQPDGRRAVVAQRGQRVEA